MKLRFLLILLVTTLFTGCSSDINKLTNNITKKINNTFSQKANVSLGECSVKKTDNGELKLTIPIITVLESYRRVGIVRLELIHNDKKDYILSKLFSKKINDWENFIIKNNEKEIIPQSCEILGSNFTCKFNKEDFAFFDESKKISLEVITKSGIKKETYTPQLTATQKYLCKGSAKSYADSLYRASKIDNTDYQETIANEYAKCIHREPVTKIVGGTSFGTSLNSDKDYAKNFSLFVNKIKENLDLSLVEKSTQDKKSYFINKFNTQREDYLSNKAVEHLDGLVACMRDKSELNLQKHVKNNFIYKVKKFTNPESVPKANEFLKKYTAASTELNFVNMSYKDIDKWLHEKIEKNRQFLLEIEHKKYGKKYIDNRKGLSFKFKEFNKYIGFAEEWVGEKDGYLAMAIYNQKLKSQGKPYLKKFCFDLMDVTYINPIKYKDYENEDMKISISPFGNSIKDKLSIENKTNKTLKIISMTLHQKNYDRDWRTKKRGRKFIDKIIDDTIIKILPEDKYDMAHYFDLMPGISIKHYPDQLTYKFIIEYEKVGKTESYIINETTTVLKNI